MRKSRNGQRSVLVASTKFIVLLMCFATVFALAMTVGLADDINLNADTGANVAEAATFSGSLVGEGTQGYDTSAASFSAAQQHMHGTGTSWTVSTRITSSLPSSYYHGASWSGTGDHQVSTWQGSTGGSTTSFGTVTENTWGYFYTYAAIQIEIPAAIDYMLQNGWTGTAVFTGQVYRPWDSGSECAAAITTQNSTGVSFNKGDYGNWGEGGASNYLYNINKSVSINANNAYLTLYVYGYVYAYAWSSGTNRVGCLNPVVTYNLTRSSTTPPADGVAPKATQTGNSTLTSNVEQHLNSAIDSELRSDITGVSPYDNPGVSNASSGTINMMNAIVRREGLTAGNGSKYAKMLELTVVETGRNDVQASASGNTFYSGIGEVWINDNRVATTPNNGNGTSGTFNYTGGSGYVQWTSIDSARSTGTLRIWFSDNVSGLKLAIRDSGNAEASFTVNVGGIKNEADKFSGSLSAPGFSNLIASSAENLNWTVGQTLDMLLADAATSTNPFVLFYSVQTASTVAELAAQPTVSNNQLGGLGVTALYPFGAAYSGSYNLDYSFEDGLLNGFGQYDGSTGATTPGYYRMTIYAMNYAGYLSSEYLTIYFKVDNVTPTFSDMELSYDTLGGTKYAYGDGNRNGIIDRVSEEDSAEGNENAVYVSTSITVKMTFTPGFSGNKVEVMGTDGYSYFVYVKGTEIVKVTDNYGAESSAWVKEGADYVMTGATGEDGTESDPYASVRVSLGTSGGSTVISVIYAAAADTVHEGKFAFTVRNNADQEPNNSSYELTAASPSWTDGAPIYIDTQKPGTPDVSENGAEPDHFFANKDGLIPSGIYDPETGTGRLWYTSGWSINTIFGYQAGVEFEEVYYLVRYYGSQEEFKADYDKFTGADWNSAWSTANNPEGFQVIDMQSSTGGFSGVTDLELNGAKAGYYVAYVIGVDRAANNSATGVFGVLADANEYTVNVSASEDHELMFGNPWLDLGMEDAGGERQYTFNRGELATFAPELDSSLAGAGAYVPYEYMLVIPPEGEGAESTARVFYHHDFKLTDAAFAEGSVKDAFASVSDGKLCLVLDAENITELPNTEGVLEFVFSYRRPINAEYANNRSTYNGAQITVPLEVTYASDGTVVPEDKLTLVPYKTVYPEGGLLDAGTYTIKILYADTESPYYVLAAETDQEGNYVIDKATLSVTVSVKDGSRMYGDVTAANLRDLIDYAITSELLGKDDGKLFTELDDYNMTLNTAFEGYMQAGDHQLVATFTTRNYTVTSSWAQGADRLVIGTREIVFSALQNAVPIYYGSEMPGTYTVQLDKSWFDFDSAEQGGLGLFASAEQIAAIFGLDASAVTDGDTVWLIAIPSDAFTLNTTANEFGYVNAGEYDFTEFRASVMEISANFAASLASEGNGKITVSPVTVTVSPVDPIPAVRVDSEEEIANVRVDIATGGDVTKFDIKGQLLVGEPVSENVYAVSGEASELSSSHNTADVTNVIIVVEPGSATIEITVKIAAGTFVITFHEDVVFSTDYGVFWDAAALAGKYDIAYVVPNVENPPVPGELTITVNVIGYAASASDVLESGAREYTIQFVPSFENNPELNTLDYNYEYHMSDGTVADSLVVNRADVTVTAVTLAEMYRTKVYGDVDPGYNISSAVADIFDYTFDGLPEGYEERFGKPTITGVYREGMDGAAYDRYDDVGVYGFVYDGFSASDRSNLNVTLASGVFDGVTVEIVQKEISLYGNGVTVFGGTDKRHDGYSAASDDAYISLDNTVILNNDNVTVIFDAANYWDGSAEVTAFGENYAVRFTGIRLDGTDSGNYLLAEEEYITDFIYAILRNPVIIAQTHFSADKVFDGTDVVSYVNIKVVDQASGVYEAFMAGEWTLIEGTFSSANAGSGTARFSIYFPTILFPTDEDADLGDYFDLDDRFVQVAAGEGGGTVVTVSGVTANIAKRIVTLDDIVFGFDDTNNFKVYDGTNVVFVPFGFAETLSASVSGFDPTDVALAFDASTAEAKVGTYAVEIANISLDGVNYELGEGLDGTDNYLAAEQKLNGTEGEELAKGFTIQKRALSFIIEFATEGDSVMYSGQDGPSTVTAPVIDNVADGEWAEIRDPEYRFARDTGELNADGSKKYEPFIYVQTENFENGVYYHDVLVNFEIAVSSNFDWDNYLFDVTYTPIDEAAGEYAVSNLFLAKEAVLNPKEIIIDITNITPESKVYDGTTDVKLNFNGAYDENDFVQIGTAKDIDSLEFAYSARFNSADVANNISVIIESGSVKLVAKTVEGNAEQTAHNQDVAGSYVITFKASSSSLRANITPATLQVEFTLPGKTYDGTAYSGVIENRVTASLSGFVPADEFVKQSYGVRVLAAGYDSADAAATKDGTVYGFELYRQNGTVNYKIDAEGVADYVAYSRNDASVDIPDDVRAKFLAEFTLNGRTVYLAEKSAFTAVPDGFTVAQEYPGLAYFSATGKIDPIQIAFRVDILDSSAFVKKFDDTVNLSAALTYGSDGDFVLVVPGAPELADDFTIADFTVTLGGVGVGRQDVIFAINSATGNSNYVFNTGGTYTVSSAATVTRADMSVALTSADAGDITGTYGSTLDYGVSYSVGGKPVIVDEAGYAYILATDWNAAFAHATAVTPAQEKLYNRNDDGSFVQAADGAYVRIDGTVGAATLVTSTGVAFLDANGNIKVDAGSYSGAKASVTATNFTVTAQSGRTVVIARAKLQVVATGNGTDGAFETEYYVGSLPVPTFNVYSSDSVADKDNVATLMNALRSAYSYKLNGTGEALVGTDYELTANLNGGKYLLTMDSDALTNYEVVLVDATGAEVAPELVIVLPALDTSVFKPVVDGSRPYTLSADGSPVALTVEDVLKGLTALDEYTFEWSDAITGSVIPAPTESGYYSWSITVTRKIAADSQYEYNYVGTYTASGNFEIAQRSVIVTLAPGVSSVFPYENTEYRLVPATDLLATDALTGEVVEGFFANAELVYVFGDESLAAMKNAGAYILEIMIGDEYVENYYIDNRVTALRVSAKPVTVTVVPGSDVHDATAGVSGNYKIEFTTSDGSSVGNFTVVYRFNGKIVSSVTGPGVYDYEIKANNPNYVAVGNSSGKMTVQITKVAYIADGTTYVTVDFGDPVAVDYKLSDTTVDSSESYWQIVQSNVQTFAGEDEELGVSGILRIQLNNRNGAVTTLANEVTITARIPDGVASGFSVYYVNADGRLVKMDPESYTVTGNTIEYKTNYIGNLVFVNSSAPAFDWWIIALAAAVLVLVIAIAILIAVLVKLHRAPDPIPVEVEPINSIMPQPPTAAPVAPVVVAEAAADIAPQHYDAPAAVSNRRVPPIIGIR